MSSSASITVRRRIACRSARDNSSAAIRRVSGATAYRGYAAAATRSALIPVRTAIISGISAKYRGT